jgi:hypothetical protein
MKYEAVYKQPSRSGMFTLEEEPVLGAMLHHDSHNIIICIDEETKRLHMSPRITTSDEKPFIEFDWHLATAFCRRCQEFAEIAITQKAGYCPHCGVLDNDQICMDQGSVRLKFNHFAHEHPCGCDDCKLKDGDEVCERCELIIAEL